MLLLLTVENYNAVGWSFCCFVTFIQSFVKIFSNWAWLVQSCHCDFKSWPFQILWTEFRCTERVTRKLYDFVSFNEGRKPHSGCTLAPSLRWLTYLPLPSVLQDSACCPQCVCFVKIQSCNFTKHYQTIYICNGKAVCFLRIGNWNF